MRNINGDSVMLYLYRFGCSVSNNIVKTIGVNVLSLFDEFAEIIIRSHIVCTSRYGAAMSTGI